MILVLEWSAFVASMLCVFCYGFCRIKGALVGIATALLFIAWGALAAIPAALLTNVVFLGLHMNNLRQALKGD